jgi:regulator of sirC expression with transglutaminase-like and TPR domain
MDHPYSSPHPPLNERERAALLSLLSDDDSGVISAVRDRLIAAGPEVCGWLQPHTRSSDPLLRKHATDIIRHFARHAADGEFTAFCLREGDELDLETGALLLARTTYPEVNVAAYRAVLDEFAVKLKSYLPAKAKPRQQLAAINDFLFTESGFHGNRDNYFDPRNNYLNQVLDLRTGNPIGLSLVYLLLARRLQLPIVGIGLPGHFVCRYQSSADSIYIDVFDEGRLLSKADCVQYLIHSAFGMQDEFLTPISPRRLLMRLCANLQQSYHHLDQTQDAGRMRGYHAALARPSAA